MSPDPEVHLWSEMPKLPLVWTGLPAASQESQPASPDKDRQFAVLIPQVSRQSVTVASRPWLVTRADQFLSRSSPHQLWKHTSQGHKLKSTLTLKSTHSLDFRPQWSSMTHREQHLLLMNRLKVCLISADVWRTSHEAQTFVPWRNSLLRQETQLWSFISMDILFALSPLRSPAPPFHPILLCWGFTATHQLRPIQHLHAVTRQMLFLPQTKPLSQLRYNLSFGMLAP